MKSILARQLDKQEKLGCDPRKLSFEQLMEYVRLNFTCAVKELTEVLDETGWKPWATSQHFNPEKYAEEIADVQLFLDNLKLALLCQNRPGYQWRDADQLEEKFTGLVHGKIDQALERHYSGTYEGFNKEDDVH